MSCLRREVLPGHERAVASDSTSAPCALAVGSFPGVAGDGAAVGLTAQDEETEAAWAPRPVSWAPLLLPAPFMCLAP